jgi:hypothetical protein
MAAKQAMSCDPEQLEALRYAVHGISAPFACGGTFVPEQSIAIGFPDQTEIPVLRAKGTYEQVELLRPLLKRCQPAPFGKGRKTRYDRSVRERLSRNSLNPRASTGLAVTLCPYLVETCIDEIWQLEHFPTEREQYALDDRVTPYDLEDTLAIQESHEDPHSFDVIWVDPPPHFNGSTTMYPHLANGHHATAPDRNVPALAHFHSCEYSATGYFGNEGSYVDFYVYGALHVGILAYGTTARTAVTVKPARASASAPRKRK